MTQFWIYSAGLILLAMAFIVLPLLRRRYRTGFDADELNLSVFKQQMAELDNDLEAGILDQDRYDAAKKDLEKELLCDVSEQPAEVHEAETRGARWMALSALLVPLVALQIYQLLGSPELIQRLAEQSAVSGGSMTTHAQQARASGSKPTMPMEELVKRLAAKLDQQPDDPEGWAMLARSYMALGENAKAIDAFEHALKLDGENIDILLAYAETVGTSQGNNFTGQAAPLIEKAYTLAPENPNVLWMSGILAYQRSEFQTALDHWNGVQAMLSPQSTELETVNRAIDDARKQLGLAPIERPLPAIAQAGMKPRGPSAGGATGSGGGGGVQVKVSLSQEMLQQTTPDDLVFIYAKAVSGPPMPLAAARKQVRDLPLTLRLDDSMAMMPQLKISGFQQVAVGARVSRSGSPMAQSGDLEGEVRPVTPGGSEVIDVVINSVHP